MPTTVGSYEAKTHLPRLLEQIANGGEEVTITKHGEPIAKLVPARLSFKMSPEEAYKELLKFQKKNLTLRGLKVKDLINEGRR